jgi:hypothetical protein
MIGRVEPREWVQLDCRPPQNILALILADLNPQTIMLFANFLGVAPVVGILIAIANPAYVAWFWPFISQSLQNLPTTWSEPPSTTPTYLPVTYERNDGRQFSPPAISYTQVLDIGVGSVHHHQQYQLITGCEMQALVNVPMYAQLYRFFNGPLQDGDGYCDGTINYYALVKQQWASGVTTYALLYQDEQTYFSQRWRLIGPDDKKGALFSLAADLESQLDYHWNPKTYWDPFKAGLIDDDSRLAVSAQVLLVTGNRQRSECGREAANLQYQWQLGNAGSHLALARVASHSNGEYRQFRSENYSIARRHDYQSERHAER